MKNYWKSLSYVEKIRLVVSVLTGLFIFLFIVLNWNEQEIDFIFLKSRMPLSIAIILSIAAGYLLALLMSYRRGVKKEIEYKILKEKVKKLELDSSNQKQQEVNQKDSEENLPETSI